MLLNIKKRGPPKKEIPSQKTKLDMKKRKKLLFYYRTFFAIYFLHIQALQLLNSSCYVV